MTRRTSLLLIALTTSLVWGWSCKRDRELPPLAPVHHGDVSTILTDRCASCHGGDSPKGGWSSATFLSSIACVADGRAAALPSDDRAPILAALARDDHKTLVSDAERERLREWVLAGTPAFRGTAHASSFVDPRSPDRHGAMLRAARWAPMLDATRDDACGRCHDGAPVRPPKVTGTAPGATSCTTCHTGPRGPLECSTCHADGADSFPHTTCFFPADPVRSGAHRAHTHPSSSRSTGIPCSTCHPVPGADVIGGAHADGTIEIVFDAKAVGGEASFDRDTKSCAVACHDRGGARPRPVWTEAAPMKCGDCHGVPPKSHYAGACSSCHAGADPKGASVTGALHVNGKVDLGDGSGGCGACHGKGDDPWPSTGAHPRHLQPTTTTPVACTDCHVVPPSIFAGGGHLDGTVELSFSGRATSHGAVPTWDGSTCKEAACHGGGLVNTPPLSPAWKSGGPGGKCGDCHGLPPPFQHTTSTNCERSECHGSEVERDANQAPVISVAGQKLHINGALEP